MKPFSTALWIAKFVASLALLLVALPASVFYGGTYVLETYQERKATITLNNSACTEGREILSQIAAFEKLPKPSPSPDGYLRVPINAGLSWNDPATEIGWYYSDGSSTSLDEKTSQAKLEVKTYCDTKGGN